MTAYVALIRAVNVSGTGKLPKEDLKAMGEACGFDNVPHLHQQRQSAVHQRPWRGEVKERLEEKVADYFGKPVPVYVRSAKEMAEAVAARPVRRRQAEPRASPISSTRSRCRRCSTRRATCTGERMALGPRLIYVSYGEGIGKIEAQAAGGETGNSAEHEQRGEDRRAAGGDGMTRSRGRQPADAAGEGDRAPRPALSRPRRAGDFGRRI